MARLYIYSVRDLAVEAFGAPICVRSAGEAMRVFFDECARPGSQFNAHPKDFELYQLAEFDDSDGRIVPLDLPRRMATGATYQRIKDETTTPEGTHHVPKQVG